MIPNFVTPNHKLLCLKKIICQWFPCSFHELISCFIHLICHKNIPLFICEIIPHSLPVFVQNVQMFICTLMWMNPAVLLYCIFHFISPDEKMLLLLHLNQLNLRAVITWQTPGKLYFALFVLMTHTSWLTVEGFSWWALIGQNWSEVKKWLKPFFTHMSISVYLLRWVMICNDVYNSHHWCEGSTVNISSTSSSVFELQVCYEFCAHLFLVFYWKMTKAVFLCLLTDRFRGKSYFVLYLLK